MALNEDVDKCFSGSSESCEQIIIGINKLKKEIENLKVEPEGRVATDKVNHWLSDLESLESLAASILENIKSISNCPNTIKFGPWGGIGAYNFDCCQCVFCITNVKVYTGDVVNGLEITYEDGITCQAGSLVGVSNEFELGRGEYINWMRGSFKGFDDEICISQLKFKTNLGMNYGPYGLGGGEKFTVAGRIVGFFGQYDRCIDSIGVYVLTFQ